MGVQLVRSAKMMKTLLLLACLVAISNAFVSSIQNKWYSDNACTKLVGSAYTQKETICTQEKDGGTYDGKKWTQGGFKKPAQYSTFITTSAVACGKAGGNYTMSPYSDAKCTTMTS